ncbi:MAG: hypothetical protein AAF088_06325 [Pseudomonadota bacterium]
MAAVRQTLILTFLSLGLAIPVPLLVGDIGWVVSIAALILGMGYFAIFGLIAAKISNAFPQDVAVIITAVSFLVVGMGSAIGNVAAGLILESTSSYTMVFSVLTGVSVFLAALSARLPKTPTEAVH